LRLICALPSAPRAAPRARASDAGAHPVRRSHCSCDAGMEKEAAMSKYIETVASLKAKYA
jgi:hypothetical protein